MLENLLQIVITAINTVYYFLADTVGLRFMDNPGTYILVMVIGFIYVPFLSKSVYHQYANPHGHYNISLVRKTVMGVTFIAAWVLFGYANFLRFLPPPV